MKNNLFEEFKISVSLLTWFTLRLEAHTWGGPWTSIPPLWRSKDKDFQEILRFSGAELHPLEHQKM